MERKKRQKKDLLMAFEQIIEKAKDSQLSEEFYSEVAKFLNKTILRSRKKRQAELNLRQKRLLALHGGFGDVDDEVANLFELADEVDVIDA